MVRERKILHLALAAGFLIAEIGQHAPGQQIPAFFGAGVVAYDPEVSIAQSGAVMDAQATVSDDRKYVTINMRATNSRLQSLQSFPVASLPLGFVGGVNLGGPGSTGAAAPANSSAAANAARSALVNPSPDEIERQARGWILARQGMYLVKPLP